MNTVEIIEVTPERRGILEHMDPDVFDRPVRRAVRTPRRLAGCSDFQR